MLPMRIVWLTIALMMPLLSFPAIYDDDGGEWAVLIYVFFLPLTAVLSLLVVPGSKKTLMAKIILLGIVLITLLWWYWKCKMVVLFWLALNCFIFMMIKVLISPFEQETGNETRNTPAR